MSSTWGTAALSDMDKWMGCISRMCCDLIKITLEQQNVVYRFGVLYANAKITHYGRTFSYRLSIRLVISAAMPPSSGHRIPTVARLARPMASVHQIACNELPK